ncbi:MAG: hypothetical protein AAF182_01740 [Pseudomonadota bacterium]
MIFSINRVLPLACCALLSGVTFVSTPSYAQEVEKLDKKNIAAFIEKTTQMSKGGGYDMSSADVRKYLDYHIHDNARFQTSMTFQVPGMPPQETQMSIQKDEFLRGVEEAEHAVNSYENKVEIKKIKLSRDKKSAVVYTVGREEGEMPTQLEDGSTQFVPIDGVSECKQNIALNDGFIQMMDAQCKTTIEFKNF